jgi:hypothetical protein
MPNLNNHYVYAHSKATTGEIFYIGKGSKNRVTSMFSRSLWWKSVVKKHGINYHILQDGLTSCEAFKRERELIVEAKTIGIELVNMNDGGTGNFGLKQSEETCNQRNESLRQVWKDPKKRAALSNAQRKSHADPVVKARRSKAMTGIVKHESWRKALSESHKGKIKTESHKTSLSSTMCSKFDAFKIYCQVHNILHPGSGYRNIDHVKARAWCKEQGLL